MLGLRNIKSGLLLVLSFLYAAVCASASSGASERTARIAEEQARLSQVSTPKDSLKIFFNIFDLSQKEERNSFRDQFLNLAARSGDEIARQEIIRLYISIGQNRSVRDSLLLLALNSPQSVAKPETLAYCRMAKISEDAKENGNPAWIERELQGGLTYLEHNLSDDIYERIVQRQRVCVLLGYALRGKSMRKYFDDYLEDVNRLPEKAYSLRSGAYRQGSMLFTGIDDFEQGKKFAILYLDLLKSIHRSYVARGRKYRSLDLSRYTGYSLLLACFPALDKNEIQRYYAAILRLAENNDEIERMLEKDKAPKMYYYYATEQYEKALEILKSMIKDPDHGVERFRLYEMLIKAAGNVNDTETLVAATREYSEMLKSFVTDRSFETYRNIQVKMDVARIHEEKEKLRQEIREQIMERKNIEMVIFWSAVGVLLVIIAILVYFFRKNMKLTMQLRYSNTELKIERDHLKNAEERLIRSKEEYEYENKIKSSFIDSISETIKQPMSTIVENSRLIVDCADNSTKPYMLKFSNLIEQNVKVLQAVVRDIFVLSEIHSSQLQLNYSGVNVDLMCFDTIDTVAQQVRPGVELKFIPSDEGESPIITTDAQRVEQILLHLLANAAKFTEEGSITLSYKIDKAAKTITFAVTDTGIGIPVRQADKIFERYYKINRHEPGLGIGLTISRLLAGLLKGKLVLDTNYKDGARFLFTIPTYQPLQNIL